MSSPAAPDQRSPEVFWEHCGRLRWAEARAYQETLWRARVDGGGTDTLLTLEHDPVITLGRRATRADLHMSDELLAAKGIEVEVADRGGELTWHGPGQLVVYAVVSLKSLKLGVSDLVRGLASGAQAWLSSLGVESVYDTSRPGLWVGDAKIGAVGMRITREVSLHGMALNISPDLSAFSLFTPCGLPDVRTTSLAELLHQDTPSLDDSAAAVARSIASHFGWQLTMRAPSLEQHTSS